MQRELEGPDATSYRGAAVDWGLAGLLLLGFGLLYSLTFQARFYGDGGVFANHFCRPELGPVNSALYLPLARMLDRLPLGADRLMALKAISIASGAIAVCCTFLIAGRLGAARGRAVGAAGLLGLSPLVWFFSTTIEAHAFHLGAVGVAAAVALLAPWRRPVLALALALVAYSPLYLTHQVGLLLAPGWVLWIQVARSRCARPFRWRTLLLAIAPIVIVWTTLTVGVGNWIDGRGFQLWPEVSPLVTSGASASYPRSTTLWEGWLLPWFLLAPLAAIGLLRSRASATRRWALAISIAAPLLFCLWIDIPERGGYTIGAALFAAILTAEGAGIPRGPRLLALLLLVLQAIAGWGEIVVFNAHERMDERVHIVRELVGPEGTVLSFAPGTAPEISVFLPRAHEYNLVADLVEAHLAQQSPEQFAAAVLSGLERPLARGRPIALDRSYRYAGNPDHSPILRAYPGLAGPLSTERPYLDALERTLRESCDTEDHPHPSWPMLLIRSGEP